MTTPTDTITNETARKLMQAFMQFHKADWQQHDINGCRQSEIRVLFCIKHGIGPDNPAMKVSDISKRLQVTSPTITQVLKGLEANGLVERHIDPNDRRAVGIKLTNKGELVIKKAARALSESFEGLIEYLGEDESNHLADLLLKVHRYFREKAAMQDAALEWR